jgi:hypothetical protein
MEKKLKEKEARELALKEQEVEGDDEQKGGNAIN